MAAAPERESLGWSAAPGVRSFRRAAAAAARSIREQHAPRLVHPCASSRTAPLCVSVTAGFFARPGGCSRLGFHLYFSLGGLGGEGYRRGVSGGEGVGESWRWSMCVGECIGRGVGISVVCARLEMILNMHGVEYLHDQALY